MRKSGAQQADIQAFLKKEGQICARTLADFSEVCRAPLQAAPGKASSPISELVKKVRSNLDNVTVYRPRVLLAITHSVNPMDGFRACYQTNDQRSG